MTVYNLPMPWQRSAARRSRRSATAENLSIDFHSIGDLLRFTAKTILDDGRPFAVIARASDVNPSTVSHLAHGVTRFPRAESLLKILGCLGYRLSVRG